MKRIFWIGAVVGATALWGGAGDAWAQADGDLPPVRTGGRFIIGGNRSQRLARSGFAFLKLSPSAPLAGMADAFVGTSNDIHSIFQNPAGLISTVRFAYVGSYNQWLAETWLGAGAMAYRTPWGVVGVSVLTLQFPQVEVNTPVEPTGIGENIRWGSVAFGVSFAKQMTDKFSVGGTVRWARERLHIVDVSAVQFDIGTIFHTGFRSMRVGMMLRNLGQNTKAITETFRLPLLYDIAGAMEVYGNQGDPFFVTAAYEHLIFRDFGARDHVGTEVWIGNILALRGGYKFGYDLESYSLGAGVRYEVVKGKELNVDFSYSPTGESLVAEHPIRLTFSGSF